MSERQQTSRDAVLKQAAQIAVQRSIARILQNAEQLLNESEDWNETNKRQFLSSLNQMLENFNKIAAQKTLSILQELLEKTKLDEKLKYLDDAVKRQHDESELKQNNTNTNTNNRTNESDNGMSPEQFLADAMKKAKAEEIRRLNAIVTELQNENAVLVESLKQKKQQNIETKKELLNRLTQSEKVLQVTEEWTRSESKQWTENAIK